MLVLKLSQNKAYAVRQNDALDHTLSKGSRTLTIYLFYFIYFITAVRIAHRHNRIVVVRKLLPSRAFLVDGNGARDLNPGR